MNLDTVGQKIMGSSLMDLKMYRKDTSNTMRRPNTTSISRYSLIDHLHFQQFVENSKKALEALEARQREGRQAQAVRKPSAVRPAPVTRPCTAMVGTLASRPGPYPAAFQMLTVHFFPKLMSFHITTYIMQEPAAKFTLWTRWLSFAIIYGAIMYFY